MANVRKKTVKWLTKKGAGQLRKVAPKQVSKVDSFVSKAKTGAKAVRNLVALELGLAGAEAGYNKITKKNQSMNSTDNMSSTGPVDKSIEKMK